MPKILYRRIPNEITQDILRYNRRERDVPKTFFGKGKNARDMNVFSSMIEFNYVHLARIFLQEQTDKNLYINAREKTFLELVYELMYAFIFFYFDLT